MRNQSITNQNLLAGVAGAAIVVAAVSEMD